jgi:hypothetical protein
MCVLMGYTQPHCYFLCFPAHTEQFINPFMSLHHTASQNLFNPERIGTALSATRRASYSIPRGHGKTPSATVTEVCTSAQLCQSLVLSDILSPSSNRSQCSHNGRLFTEVMIESLQTTPLMLSCPLDSVPERTQMFFYFRAGSLTNKRNHR